MRLRPTALLVATAAIAVAVAPATAAGRGPVRAKLRAVTAPVTTKVAAPVTTATPSTTTVAAPVTTEAPSTTAAVDEAAAALSVPAVSEMSASCEATTPFQAFAAFGDTADYAFAPGGSFEHGTAGWSLNGAAVVSGNETAGVYPGTSSLFIKDHGRVVSPWFCVTADHPHFRYVARGGEIEMEIDYKVVGDSDIDDDLVGETNAPSHWAASEQHELATEIPGHKLKKGVVARIIFEAEDDVYVDNVLVDPYRRG